MFVGRHDHAIDDKGRAMMPKPFREFLAELGDRSVWVTKGMGDPRRLDIRPASSFKAYQLRATHAKETATVARFKQFYFGNAVEVELDGAGRLLVPSRLRRWCALGDKVTFSGADMHHFELWRPEDFDAFDDLFVEDWVDIRNQLSDAGL